MVLGRISHAKNRMEGPDTFANTWNPKDREIGKLFEGYIKALKNASALDFDDLLLATVELFDQNPAVRERYAHKFHYVMVDEYQDTNRPQYLLVKQIAGKHRNLAVVGDPDQSIYKWRGADLRNIMDFETDFSGRADRPARAELSIDRSDPRRRVGGDRQQPATGRRRRCGRTSRAAPRSGCSAAPTSSKKPNTSRASSRKALEDDYKAVTAVLYRTNAQSRAVEDSLRAAGISYVVLGGVGFYERREIKDALSYLKLILNPHDDIALRRVINVPARGIGKGVMDALEAVDVSQVDMNLPPLLAGLSATVAQDSLWTKLVAAVDGRLLSSRQVASLAAFRDLIIDARRRGPPRIGLDRCSARCSISPATCATSARTRARKPKAASRT